MKPTIRLTPPAWELAEKNSVTLEELASVSGTGDEGRITSEDVRQYLVRRRQAALARPDPRHRKRVFVAVAIWVAWVLTVIITALVGGEDAGRGLGAFAFLFLLFAVPRVAVLEGRKWYEVFGLIVPIVNLIVVGRVVWYAAGVVVGAKSEATRVPAPVALAPEEARAKLAAQAAEAVRAAEARETGR